MNVLFRVKFKIIHGGKKRLQFLSNFLKNFNYIISVIVLGHLFGYRYNQLPGLIEQTPQWLPGPSPLLPVIAGPLADYQTGFKLCSDALQLLFNYWHGLT
jgi:hypothetical protein